MLINAQRSEELRLAIVNGNQLENYKVEFAESGLTRGNIYRGLIANVQPSLNAAFIDYGADKQGFLAIQDVVPQAYYRTPGSSHPRIEEVLSKGKPIIVQVTKDAVGTKGAALTTGLSLAGRYLVLTPFEETRGVSRKVEDEDTRRKLKQIANGFDLPPGCGVILRTAALEQTKTTLARDLASLLRLWKRLQSAATNGKGTHLLYTDQDLILQSLRDYLDASIEEVLIDDADVFQKAQSYMQAFMPRSKTRLTFYSERMPLFTKYGLEAQIDRIYERKVDLPSGGSIVIDATEALTAIDVNSGRSTKAATQEETAVHTNLEAAVEVARQLRLRDLGGIVVVDFIDMRASKNQRKVEKAMKDALKSDKARSTVGRISANGLVEINRQRIQQALQVRTHRTCPTCNGVGRLASEEMVSVSLLRRIEARAASGSIQGVKVCLHPELADSFQNHYRKELAALEAEFDLEIEVIAAPGLHRPDEQIEWYKRERPLPAQRSRPAPPILQPWDLSLTEDEPEDEEAEEASAAARPGEPGDEAHGAEGNGKRKRRKRGGRRKKGRAGENGPHDAGAPEGGAREAGADEAEPSDDEEPGGEPAAPARAGAWYSRAVSDDEPAGRLASGDSEGDDDEGDEPAEGEGRAAKSEGEETPAGERRRKRRGTRGGRRKKLRTAGAPAPVNGEARAQAAATADRAQSGTSGDDESGPDDDGPDGDEGPAAEAASPGEEGAEGAGRRNKRRRGGRRRRRPGAKDAPSAGTEGSSNGAEGGSGPSEDGSNRAEGGESSRGRAAATEASAPPPPPDYDDWA